LQTYKLRDNDAILETRNSEKRELRNAMLKFLFAGALACKLGLPVKSLANLLDLARRGSQRCIAIAEKNSERSRCELARCKLVCRTG